MRDVKRERDRILCRGCWRKIVTRSAPWCRGCWARLPTELRHRVLRSNAAAKKDGDDLGARRARNAAVRQVRRFFQTGGKQWRA